MKQFVSRNSAGMKKSLLDLVFASEKRKNMLLLLQEDSKTMENILISLNTTRTSLLPQIRILKDHYLVSQCEDTYELTAFGKNIVDKMAPLLDIVEVIDADVDYWGTHNIDFIPPHLLHRIGELENCRVIVPDITEIYNIGKKFYDASKRSKSYFTLTTFLHPSIPEIVPEFIRNEVQLNIIIHPDVFEKVRTDYSEEFAGLIHNEFVNVFVYPKEMGFQIISFNDFYLMLNLLKSNGEIDNKYLLCSTPDAIEWGKELFDHYLKGCIRLTEI